MTIENALNDIFNSILSNAFVKRTETVEAVRHYPDVEQAVNNLKAYDLGAFKYGFWKKFEDLQEGLVEASFGKNRDMVFLVQQTRFVENHFRYLFSDIEGSSCCADKAKCIVRRLMHYFHTGTEIAFDYSAEYTYQFPTTIFKTHQEILDFFVSLRSLAQGLPKPYLEQLTKVHEAARAAKTTQV